MVTGQLMFQPLKFDWHSDDQQTAFKEWQGHITLDVGEPPTFPKKDGMPASLVS